jgi:hypothetical protein
LWPPPAAQREEQSRKRLYQLTLFVMTNKERTAFIRILIHYCPDEGKHFAESGFPKRHIFRDLMVLAKFVDKRPRSTAFR